MHDLTLLNDRQWENIQPLLPPKVGFGRPRADDRLVLEGILWVLRSGARWRDLPERYPSASTCWRRLRDWEEEEVWLNIWRLFLCELEGGSTGMKCSWTAALHRPKKGALRGSDQTGQRYEVDGGGRRRGYTSGKSTL